MANTKVVMCTPISFQGAILDPFVLPSLGDGSPQYHFWYEDLLYCISAYERDTLSCWLTRTEIISDGRLMTAEVQDLFLHCAALILKWPTQILDPTALAALWIEKGAHSTIDKFVSHHAYIEMVQKILHGKEPEDCQAIEERIA